MSKARRWLSALLIIILALAVALFRIRFTPSPVESGVAPSTGLPLSNETGFSRADGPRPLSFPADYGPHPDFQTEWWYYTGNLTTDAGRHFGFELTFFRRGLVPPSQQAERLSDWGASQVYMGHFTLTDVDGGQFHAFERLERGAAGLAGAQSAPVFQVWIDNWSAETAGENTYQLRASQAGISLALSLVDSKGPVLEGDRGYSQKGPDPGNASYYFSQTRLITQGTVTVDGETDFVTGASWMDHEFSTSALAPDEVGWDWYGIQLEDGTDLMLYQMRSAAGEAVGSNGTRVAASGEAQTLTQADFSIKVNSTWKSPHSGAVYPAAWTVEIPAEHLTLQITPYLPDQELNLSFVYWEGAVKVTGSRSGQPVSGQGYIELTGYASPMNGQF